jgi:hypothetical protein
MDKKKILAGQEWENQIWRAATKADIFCLLLSSRSVNKRGFVRKEIRFALEKWKEKLPEDVYLIPCRIENVVPPFELSHLQYIDVLNEKGVHDLKKLLRFTEQERVTDNANKYETKTFKPNLKHVDFEVEYPEFQAADLKNLNTAIGSFLSEVLDTWKQDQPPPFETSTKSFVEGGFIVHFPTARIVSMHFSVHWYGAGAAHPNHFFKTLCFDRRAGEIIVLRELFANETPALNLISNVCRLELRKQKIIEGRDIGAFPGEDRWIDEGAGVSWDHFRNFIIRDKILELMFAAYDVGAYAWGPRFVEIDIMSLQEILSERIVDLVTNRDVAN